MFESFEPDDRVLHSSGFKQEEVLHNLIHRIAEYEDAIKLKSIDDQLIFTQSTGHNAWLWVSKELEVQQRDDLVRQLAERVKDSGIPGISAEPETAKAFAEAFCAAKGKLHHTNMMLKAYHCPEVRKPGHVSGSLLQAGEAHIPVIAEFTARFVEDAFGTSEQQENFLSYADEAVRAGNLYLWVVDGVPVSMAAIAHRSARHVRINDVYTPRTHRKQGYASAAVAELCQILLAEGLTPVLYADDKNPDSNKVYQTVGFVEAGQIADIKFD
ncbi:GNAT family N-acetyltransferase [Paenibacillus sp. IHBB 3054]|uniref:GNAT family N-acetyltransferase n=1 Tax=Paenibacillus sp. IHBB 3054 TaxID=3425689 RepID=UPI003F677D3B